MTWKFVWNQNLQWNHCFPKHSSGRRPCRHRTHWADKAKNRISLWCFLIGSSPAFRLQRIWVTSAAKHAKDRKAYQGEYPGKFNQWIRRLRIGSPTCVGAARNWSSERGKSCDRSSLLLFCLLLWYFILLSSPAGLFQKQRSEKGNFLLFPLSQALFSTADVEKDRLEIGNSVSWGLFTSLILISNELRFFYPVFWKK